MACFSRTTSPPPGRRPQTALCPLKLGPHRVTQGPLNGRLWAWPVANSRTHAHLPHHHCAPFTHTCIRRAAGSTLRVREYIPTRFTPPGGTACCQWKLEVTGTGKPWWRRRAESFRSRMRDLCNRRRLRWRVGSAGPKTFRPLGWQGDIDKGQGGDGVPHPNTCTRPSLSTSPSVLYTSRSTSPRPGTTARAVGYQNCRAWAGG
jgi:hypothetical protein